MEWNSGPFAAKTLPTGFPSLHSFYNQENLIVGEGQSHQAIYLLFKKKKKNLFTKGKFSHTGSGKGRNKSVNWIISAQLKVRGFD